MVPIVELMYHSTGTMTYLSRAFWSSMRSKSGGTYVYRGYGAARVASGKDKEGATGRRSASHSRRGSSSSTRSAMAEKDDTLLKRAISRDGSRNGPHAAVIDAFKDIGAGAEEAIGGFKEGLKEIKDDGKNGVAAAQQGHLNAVEEENAPLVEANDDDAPCTDLILVIHGIGQQLATQYESYNFVYAGNQLRQVMRKQSTNPALASIIRDRRVQVNEFALVMNVGGATFTTLQADQLGSACPVARVSPTRRRKDGRGSATWNGQQLHYGGHHDQ